MRIIYNNIIPFKGFAAINLFGILLVRKGARVTERMLNHERIHSAQMKEMGYVFFYLWYFVEWIVKLFKYGKDSYRNLSFEREAYDCDDYLEYLNHRPAYSWWDYL